jgi:hypothetical protein
MTDFSVRPEPRQHETRRAAFCSNQHNPFQKQTTT